MGQGYGYLSRDTDYTVLTAGEISDANARVVHRHDRTLGVHMGGIDGWAPSCTCLGAGTGQGCPVSGMKYCIYRKVTEHEACCNIPPVITSAGKLNRMLLMDATQWLPGDRGHLYTLAQGIERAGRITNLHSDPTKTFLISTEMRDGEVHFLRDTVYFNGHPVQCATSLNYIHVLGGHAPPHIFDLADPAGCSLAPDRHAGHSAPPGYRPTPPSPCPLPSAMAWSTVSLVCGPPLYVLCVCWTPWVPRPCGPLQAALAASALCLRDVTEGGIGIPPAPVTGYANLLSVCIEHLNQQRPLVRRSTRHGLLIALSRFDPRQPCLTAALRLRCAAHHTDHNLFVALCHQCDVSIHLPPAQVLPEHPPHVMALASSELEVADTHDRMIAGTQVTRTGQGGRVFPPHPPNRYNPPPIARCHAIFPPPSPCFPRSRITTASSIIFHGAQSPDDVVEPWLCSAPSRCSSRYTPSASQ